MGLAAWMTLAAVPYIAWKTAVVALAGLADGPMLVFLAVLFLLAVLVISCVGFIAGMLTEREAGGRPGSLVVVAPVWFLAGFALDMLLGLAAAGYLSRVALSLGDVGISGFRSEIGAGGALAFAVFALGGGIAGTTALMICRWRSTASVQAA